MLKKRKCHECGEWYYPVGNFEYKLGKYHFCTYNCRSKFKKENGKTYTCPCCNKKFTAYYEEKSLIINGKRYCDQYCVAYIKAANHTHKRER